MYRYIGLGGTLSPGSLTSPDHTTPTTYCTSPHLARISPSTDHAIEQPPQVYNSTASIRTLHPISSLLQLSSERLSSHHHHHLKMWPTAISHLSHLSLPASILTSPFASALLPITLGSLVGITVNTRSSTKSTYSSLRQPPGRPPAWLFAPVWTVLYAGMGYASHRVYMARPDATIAGLYTLQLGLNFAWMPLFFGARKAVAGMVDIVALAASAGVLTVWYAGVDGVAAGLMVPYLAWLGYATYLTAGVGMLNGWDIEGAVRREEAAKKD